MGRDAAAILADLQRAEDGLHAAACDHEHVVLWFEHDSYDQLILARCLARFAETLPRQLELISVDRFPGTARFIGIGQLPPEALRLLWSERRTVSGRQLATGRAVWESLRLADPTPLAAMARAYLPELPHLAKALRRHCQELPWLRDGLGLTERLVLQRLTGGPKTVGEIYRDLMTMHEPLPWLGDLMFLFVIEDMKRAKPPALVGSFDGEERHWPQERLALTALGRSVLAGEVDWLSLSPPERWLGGVRIAAARPCWRWDDAASTTVLVQPPILPHPL